MSYIERESRCQSVLLPDLLDDYITEDNPVRFLDAFARTLGFLPPCSSSSSLVQFSPNLARAIAILADLIWIFPACWWLHSGRKPGRR